MKEVERVVRVYEESIRLFIDSLATIINGMKPSPEQRARCRNSGRKLQRIRKRYLPSPLPDSVNKIGKEQR